MRGGRKTRCAVGFCKRLMEGYFRGTPRHVVLITSVIFVRETEGKMENAMMCLESGMAAAKAAWMLGKHPNTISNWRRKEGLAVQKPEY